MIKAKDLYRIYLQRPEEERTNDSYFKALANSQAKYLNAVATNGNLTISLGSYYEDAPRFYVYGRNSRYLLARVYPAISGQWHAFFDIDNPVRSEVHLVDCIFNAIAAMEEKL